MRNVVFIDRVVLSGGYKELSTVQDKLQYIRGMVETPIYVKTSSLLKIVVLLEFVNDLIE